MAVIIRVPISIPVEAAGVVKVVWAYRSEPKAQYKNKTYEDIPKHINFL